MNVEKTQAKLPTLTDEELATLATMVVGEQRKRKLKQRCQRDYTLHREKRLYVPPQRQKDAGIPIAVKNAVVREFRDSRNGTEPPFLSPAHFEQIFNKHHPGGSMMEDDWCGDGEY